MTSPYHFFLSKESDRENNREVYKRIDLIEECLHRCDVVEELWFVDPKEYESGFCTEKEIYDRIHKSDCLLIFVTESYQFKFNTLQLSSRCYFEMKTALHLKKKIIAILMEASIKDPIKWLPPFATFFSDFISIDLTDEETFQKADKLKIKCELIVSSLKQTLPKETESDRLPRKRFHDSSISVNTTGSLLPTSAAIAMEQQIQNAKALILLAASQTPSPGMLSPNRPQTHPPSQESFDFLIKHVLIGDSGVGKSCLLQRWAHDQFTSTLIPTLGVEFRATIDTLYGKKIKQQVWETAGQEQFRSMTISYCLGAMSVFLIYDVTNRTSFENIRSWYELVMPHVKSNVVLTLIGTKCDCEYFERTVSFEEGLTLAKEFGWLFFETSAKEDINVTLAFQVSSTLALLLSSSIDSGEELLRIEIEEHANQAFTGDTRYIHQTKPVTTQKRRCILL